eukprot:Clim_evm64s134 gene=Clim_evmTU64s134
MTAGQLSFRAGTKVKARKDLQRTVEASRLLKRKSWTYVPAIGLEVHAQIASKTKLFSSAPMTSGDSPNTAVAVLDYAAPGALPVLNRNAVRLATVSALALGCQINPVSMFDRKHYFYHDMPLGYQITQQRQPLASGGLVRVRGWDPTKLGSHAPEDQAPVRIQHLQIEQDTGRTTAMGSTGMSAVDLNRAGSPLMEIVTAPDLTSASHAAEFVRQLRLILQRIGACGGNMAEGQMRVDCNVSICHQDGSFGTRVEVKNVAGTHFLERAIQLEIDRQVSLWKQGREDEIVQETRAFNALTNTTTPLRSKEESMDYRFMPDPDIPPLRIESEFMEGCRVVLPELPEGTIDRLMEDHKLGARQAYLLVHNGNEMVDFFTQVIRDVPDNAAQTAANLITGPIFELTKKQALDEEADEEKGFLDLPISPAWIGRLAMEIHKGNLKTFQAREVLQDALLTKELDPDLDRLIDARGFGQSLNQVDLEAIVVELEEEAKTSKKVSRAFAKLENDVDKGVKGVMGLVMQRSQGNAKPQDVVNLLRKRYSKS